MALTYRRWGCPPASPPGAPLRPPAPRALRLRQGDPGRDADGRLRVGPSGLCRAAEGGQGMTSTCRICGREIAQRFVGTVVVWGHLPNPRNAHHYAIALGPAPGAGGSGPATSEGK